MLRAVVFLALGALLGQCRGVAGKVCPSIDVRNNATSLEKLRNCTIIMGHLRLVLMQTEQDSSVFESFSFPELTEIVDNLIVFHVKELRTLENLFPNLRVIRGRKLFLEYSMVFYQVPHLQKIGLPSLELIGRGAVKIDGCPNLCYAKNIDWTALGASMLDFALADAADCKDLQKCPPGCGEHCWSEHYCQKKRTMCEDFYDGEKCVESCPENKVTNYDMRRCLTREECVTLLNGNWFVFNRSCLNECPFGYNRDVSDRKRCIYVGENYTKVCDGGVLDTLFFVEEMKDCTYVNGSLNIHISNPKVEQHLEKYLGHIVTIKGSLKIFRSKGITSLSFFKNLRYIDSENSKYALFVYENENLRKLFDDDFNLTLNAGTVAFHDNPQLCLSEIERFQKSIKIIGSVDTEISQISNGYKSVCNERIMNIYVTENNPTNVTIKWDRVDDLETVVGYTLYYMKDEGQTNLTYYDNVCDKDGWDGIFVMEEKAVLKDLIPYTLYHYYIRTFNTLHNGEQTPIYNFTTSSKPPTAPVDVEAKAVNESTIRLDWEEPKLPNGVLVNYNITYHVQKDYVPMIRERDYCEYPHTLHSKEEPAKEFSRSSTNTTDYSNCSCPASYYRQLILKETTCSNNDNRLEVCVNSFYENQFSFTNTLINMEDSETKEAGPLVRNVMVAANVTSFEIANLKHFTLYVFYIQACNNGSQGFIQCGKSEMVAQRTKKKASADVIRDLEVKLDSKNAHVSWSQPWESNSVLVSYQIEYKRTDSEHSKPRVECITDEEFQRKQHRYTIDDLSVGEYWIRVQAVSLAGPGAFTEWKEFYIGTRPRSKLGLILPLVFVFVLLVVAGGGVAWYWKRRRYLGNNHLITSVNPDYAGGAYVEDEWEMDRSDIVIGEERGRGSFGVVYEGLIKSQQRRCAVKTVSQDTPMSARLGFLYEGAVMKTFSGAHHVVKLLGIVSRGQPPLVIMEWMERGDLKTYLRRCREPSRNLTTNELYRMAAQIADGMAYLSLKKFVHRDLAARNCMVADDHTVKVGDFGMTRDIYENDYYRKETMGLLPVRWMAPESLADGVFTTDSDMWSYGVVLWEMATLGAQPYPGLSNDQVLNLVKRKGKPDRPPECSDFFYSMMEKCWKWEPSARPTFSTIVHEWVGLVGEDFRLQSFVFSQEGHQLALSSGPRVRNAPAMVPQTEEEYFGRYDPADEEVSLYRRELDRPTLYQPLINQR